MTVAGIMFLAAWLMLGLGIGYWVIVYCIREPRGQHAGAGEGAWNASTLTGLDRQRRPEVKIAIGVGFSPRGTPLFGSDVISGYDLEGAEEVTAAPVWIAPEDMARLNGRVADVEDTMTIRRTLVGAAA